MIKEVEINKIKEAEYNAREKLQKGDREYENIKNSILNFGYVEPIVWNKRTGNCVGGHQRLQILKDLGKKTVQVSVVDMNEKEEKQLSLALNKIKGKWDFPKLKEIIKSIDTEEVWKTGFSSDEIALLLEEDEIEDIDFSEWEFEPIKQNFVITLKFETFKAAKEWAERHGYRGQCKEGTNTTVIRIG